MKATKYQPAYVINALTAPWETLNLKLMYGFHYGWTEPLEKVVVVFSKEICAN